MKYRSYSGYQEKTRLIWGTSAPNDRDVRVLKRGVVNLCDSTLINAICKELWPMRDKIACGA